MQIGCNSAPFFDFDSQFEFRALHICMAALDVSARSRRKGFEATSSQPAAATAYAEAVGGSKPALLTEECCEKVNLESRKS